MVIFRVLFFLSLFWRFNYKIIFCKIMFYTRIKGYIMNVIIMRVNLYYKFLANKFFFIRFTHAAISRMKKRISAIAFICNKIFYGFFLKYWIYHCIQKYNLGSSLSFIIILKYIHYYYKIISIFARAIFFVTHCIYFY